jgi:hypothetical protein
MSYLDTLTVEQLRVIVADWIYKGKDVNIKPGQIHFYVDGKEVQPVARIREKV